MNDLFEELKKINVEGSTGKYNAVIDSLTSRKDDYMDL